MKLGNKITLSQHDGKEVKRKLSYLDFVSRRSFALPADDDNIVATLYAISLLTGRTIGVDTIRTIITNADSDAPDARFVHSYYRHIANVLQRDVDGATIDEARILDIASSLCNTHEDMPSQRNRVDVLLNRRTSQQQRLLAGAALGDVVEWLLVQSRSVELHPLLVVGLFLYQFMTQETLRESREVVMHILALVLLRRCGCEWLLHYTPARIMVLDRVAYHRAVKQRTDDATAVAQWLVYWVDCLYRAAGKACEVTAPRLPLLSSAHNSPLNTRQLHILRFIEHNQPVKFAAIVTHLHKESPNTIKKDLQQMKELGFITTEGVLKGTVYYKS